MRERACAWNNSQAEEEFYYKCGTRNTCLGATGAYDVGTWLSMKQLRDAGRRSRHDWNLACNRFISLVYDLAGGHGDAKATAMLKAGGWGGVLRSRAPHATMRILHHLRYG